MEKKVNKLEVLALGKSKMSGEGYVLGTIEEGTHVYTFDTEPRSGKQIHFCQEKD